MARIAVLGSGALGGLYAACLHDAGHDVHLLLRSDYATVVTEGLYIQSPWGDRHCTSLHCHQDPLTIPQMDAVCICWKTMGNQQLPACLASMVGPHTTVIFIQNGIGAEQDIAHTHSQLTLGAGLAFLCANRIAPGQIHHLDYGTILFAPINSASADGIRQVSDWFVAAGVPVQWDDDLLAARWQKLVWNMPFNGLCALTGLNTAEIMADTTLRKRAEVIMREVVGAATARGHLLPDDIVEMMLRRTERMTPYRPSMMLDRVAGRPMELEAIYARPLALGAEHGLSMTQSQRLYQELRVL